MSDSHIDPVNHVNSVNPWMVSTLVLAGIIVGFGLAQLPTWNSEGQASVVTPPPVAQPSAPESAPVALTDEQYEQLSASLVDDDASIGSADAPVTIVEFSDYQCPFCGKFFNETLPSLQEKYIDTGKVRLIYRDYPLDFHKQAQKAAEAAECAGEQDKYFQMHGKIFEGGVEWQGDGAAADSAFKRYAAAIGLNTAQFNTCLDDGEQAGEVRQDFLDGVKYGINGTPGFFIQGRPLSGAQPFEVFEGMIEELL